MEPASSSSPSSAPDHDPLENRRIVSLSPNITEILFALGLDERIAGVTRYCDYPPEALTLPKVGGYYDPNYEEIVRLQPDLVILLESQEAQKEHLVTMGLQTLTVDNQTIAAILKSIITIGEASGRSTEAHEIAAHLRQRTEVVKDKTSAVSRPRVMVSVGRTLGIGSLDEIYIAGRNGFYDELITLAGGVNAYGGKRIKFPMLSAEGILQLNPDIIIDMVPDLKAQGLNEKDILKTWELVEQVNAVQNNRVYLFSEDYAVIPGPRFILILEAMARAIHPEVGW